MSITADQRERVAELYAAGRTVREISREVGISVGSVSKIVTTERERIPDLEELRDFSGQLKASGFSLPEAKRGAAVLAKMDGTNMSLEDIEDAVDFFDCHGEKTGEAIQAALRLMEIEVAEIKPYEKIVTDAQLASKTRVGEEQRVTALRQEWERLDASIREMKKLSALQAKMDSKGINVAGLDAFIDFHTLLEGLGFSSDSAKTLAAELKGRGMTPEEASRTLVSALSTYMSLDAALSTLQDTIRSMLGNLEILRSSITEAEKKRDKYLLEQNRIATKKTELEAEIRKLESKRDVVAGEVRAGDNTAIEVGLRLDELEGKVRTYDPINVLVLLLSRPKPGTLSRPLAFNAVLAVLEGLRSALPPGGLSAAEDWHIRGFMEKMLFWQQGL